MSNINTTPNHLHVSDHDVTVGLYFGALQSVSPDHLRTHPHLIARFKGDVRISLDPQTAMDLAREITTAVAGVASWSQYVADHVGGDE